MLEQEPDPRRACKRSCVSNQRGFVTDRPSSFALRQLRAHLGARFVLATQAGIALALGLSGPFGTIDTLATLPRLAYWTGIVFGTYALGSALTLLLLDKLDAASRWPLVLRILRGGAIIGLAVTALLSIWNLAFFGFAGFGPLAATSILVVFVVSCSVLALRELYPDPEQDRAAAEPALLQRLPLEKRGALVALTATDHYVEIVTDKGRELVLMRLADAIDETAPVRGMQVHRSHWVALAHVLAAERRGDGARLEMSAGMEIPVSRRHMPSIRAAGLLPQ